MAAASNSTHFIKIGTQHYALKSADVRKARRIEAEIKALKASEKVVCCAAGLLMGATGPCSFCCWLSCCGASAALATATHQSMEINQRIDDLERNYLRQKPVNSNAIQGRVVYVLNPVDPLLP